MPRYEKQTARGVEYVELTIDGKTVCAVTGRVGSKPAVKRSSYPSQFAAASRFRRAIPTAKGFVHISQLRATLQNPELERAIAERPDDRALREVYGDWLLDRDDPRGELIALQRGLATATGAEAKALRKKERALLAKHSSLLLGRVDEVHDLAAYDHWVPVRVAWNLGFLEDVDLQLPVRVELDRRFKRVEIPTVAEAIGFLATHPSARFLRRISLWPEADRAAIRALCALPRSLRSVKIWFDWMQQVPDLSELCAAHPDLEQLTLRLSKQPLEGVAFPNLRALDLRSNLTPGHLDAIAETRWPRLQALGITVGGYETSAKPHHFDALFTRTCLPALTTLRLRDIPDEQYAIELARRATRLPELATVELEGARVPVNVFERALATPRIAVKATDAVADWRFCGGGAPPLCFPR